MKLILRLFSLSVIVFVSQAASAQSLIFYQNTRTDAFLVKQNGGGPSQGITDHFIGRLATSANKPVTSTEYVVAQDEYVRLTKVNATQYDVYATLGNTRLTGDTKYRGFSMTEQLKPTAVQFTLQRMNKAGQVVQSFPFGEVALSGESTMVANFRATDSTGQFSDCTVRLTDKQLLYSSVAKGTFDQRTILIDDYYASVPKIDGLANEIKSVNPDDFEHLESQQTALNQYTKRFTNITDANFPSALDLKTADPANYLTKSAALNTTIQDLNTRLARTKNEIPERYYQRGMAELQQSKPTDANKDFLEAVRLKPAFAPAHLELARLRYKEGNIVEAKSQLLTIAKDCQPDEPTRAGATQLGTTIYQSQLTNADYAIQQKKYSASLQSLADARSLCTDLKLTCTPQLEDLTSKAHTGIFLGKVDSARVLFTAANYQGCETKANEALSYQKANPTYVKDASPALKVQSDAQNRIYQISVQTATALGDQGKLKDAEAEARKALAYQKDHSAAIAEPSLANAALLKIKGLQYKDDIAKAKAFNMQRQFRQALPLLDDAIVIETEFPVVKDPGLWSMAQAAAKPTILEDYMKGQEQAKANKLADARSTGQGAKAMTEKYRLQSDAEILKASESESKEIANQECINAQNEFDGLIKTAESQKQMKQFIEASGTYDKALQVVNQQSSCGIDNRRAVDGKTQIAVAVQYQQFLLTAQKSIDENDSKKAIDTYNQAGEVFSRENLQQRFGLTHASLFDYILGSGRVEFTRYGAQYFTERKQYEQALELMHKTVQMGVSKSLVKELMIRLGTELAIRDKQTASGSDPKTKVLEYTRGNKNFAALSKAYLKARK